MHQQTNKQKIENVTEKLVSMGQKKKEKITRDCLRAMKIGDTVVVQCKDGYDLDSQKNTAYAMQKMENCRFTCKSDGLTLTVTKYDVTMNDSSKDLKSINQHDNN